MKKLLITLALMIGLVGICCGSASAVVNNTIKVGLRYGSGAMSEANLENQVGSGYAFGYFDSSRNFVSLGTTAITTITMNAASGRYYIQLSQSLSSYAEAAALAAQYSGAYPAYLNGSYAVRVGNYGSSAAAEQALASLGVSGSVVSSSGTLVVVTVTGTDTALFAFDCSGLMSLGVMPQGNGQKAVTWFRGYRYYGGFEYSRVTGGSLYVINVVDLEDYVKGVVPYEMSASWPQAALQAQAVCARTYASHTTKHLSNYGFDVCNTTDCQVYYGMGSSTANSDQAVDSTAGMCIYYNGSMIDAVYSSSDGGATEDAENVWGGKVGYLIGKSDPYESMISIPNYSYTVTYTAAELTDILRTKGYSLGTVANVYVSEYTAVGNVKKVTFVDTAGKTLTVSRSTCRSIFSSSTYGKSVRSMRFQVSGGTAGSAYYVNGSSNTISTISGASLISGKGTVSGYNGSSPYVITSSGTAAMGSAGTTTASADGFTITGTGNGHNVGMSQYGAKAMAEQGYSYRDILNFYYTNITIG